MELRSNDKSVGKILGKILGKSPGKIGVPGFLRPRWGVKGSLFSAFAVIAGMAIIISAVAAMVLGRLGGNMVDLTGRDIPRLAASLQLAAQSASLAGQGPALLASQSEEVLNERARKMKETQGVTLEKLGEITELTGGRAFTIDNPNDLADVATKIGVELRNQYVLGYRPAKVVRDGKWRKIKVKLLPPKGLPPLRVYARTGYYAPVE